MIFPAGKRKNIDSFFNPLTDDPRSPSYEPELKKNVRKAEREARQANTQGVDNPNSVHYQPEMKKGNQERHEWAQVTTAEKISKDQQLNTCRKGCSIQTARGEGYSDIGGPVRHMHSQTNNSIWDPNVLSRIKSGETEVSRGEQIKAAIKDKEDQHEAMKKKNFHVNLDDFADAYKRGDFAKADSVNPHHASGASNHSNKISKREFSIFDFVDKQLQAKAEKADFNQLPEKTEGEMIAQSARDRREKKKKERSWESISANRSTKTALGAFFDKIRQVAK